MAILYAYGYKPKVRRSDVDIGLGDLSTVGNGPDLFDVVVEALTNQPLPVRGEAYQVPPRPHPPAEDTRSKWLEITPARITVDRDRRIVWGRVMMSRRAEPERKTKLSTGTVTQYEEGDPGERPLFFLLSIPAHEPEALVVLEHAQPYGMTGFWSRELKKLITERIPESVYVEEAGRRRPKTKNVTLGWGPYGALETPDFIERYFDGQVDEAAASRDTTTNQIHEGRVVQIVRPHQVNKGRLARLVRDQKKREVAELVLPAGMVAALDGDPDEVKFRGSFAGREKVITMSRSRVSQPGVEIPRDAPRDDDYPSYASAKVLHESALELAQLVGHGHRWVPEA